MALEANGDDGVIGVTGQTDRRATLSIVKNGTATELF